MMRNDGAQLHNNAVWVFRDKSLGPCLYSHLIFHDRCDGRSQLTTENMRVRILLSENPHGVMPVNGNIMGAPAASSNVERYWL